jgi:hypothetical protein
MTVAKHMREENQRKAFELMLRELGDQAIDTRLFDTEKKPFAGEVLYTTWQELLRDGYTEQVRSKVRLTAKGWLLALEAADVTASSGYRERLGRVLAVMKARVKGRTESAVVDLWQLSKESGEPEGWIFNVVDSRASSAIGSGRRGASWYENERGRLVEIPVDFNLEPIDIASSLTVKHLERIQELEHRIEEIQEDRAQFHCPHCDAPFINSGMQDFIEHHTIVTYEMFACGYSTADGIEDSPCPHGPNWPRADDFDFRCTQNDEGWECVGIGKTRYARRISTRFGKGKTREEAEKEAKYSIVPRHLRKTGTSSPSASGKDLRR